MPPAVVGFIGRQLDLDGDDLAGAVHPAATVVDCRPPRHRGRQRCGIGGPFEHDSCAAYEPAAPLPTGQAWSRSRTRGNARITGIGVPMPAESLGAKLGNTPPASLWPRTASKSRSRPPMLTTDYERFERLVDGESGVVRESGRREPVQLRIGLTLPLVQRGVPVKRIAAPVETHLSDE